MALDIPLDGLGADANDSTPHKSNPFDETMSLALESPKGITLEFDDKTAASSMRFRFYRRIKEHKAHNVTSFNDLQFRLEGSNLIIKRLPPFTLKVND